MKRLVFILFMILTCLRPLGHERMTRFTKTVVMLLVQSTTKQREASGNVFLSSWSDLSHYYLNVQFCEDNSGSSGGNGRISVKYLTSERNPFFKATKCTSDPDEDDLKSIQICLNKDKTFCPMFSFYITPQEDISPLYELVKSQKIKTNVSASDLNYIYPAYLVETPPMFKSGLDSLHTIIQKNVQTAPKVHRRVLVNLIVDQNGNATIAGIEDGSGDISTDTRALSIAEMVAKEAFVPAVHRGVVVRSYYTLVLRL